MLTAVVIEKANLYVFLLMGMSAPIHGLVSTPPHRGCREQTQPSGEPWTWRGKFREWEGWPTSWDWFVHLCS